MAETRGGRAVRPCPRSSSLRLLIALARVCGMGAALLPHRALAAPRSTILVLAPAITLDDWDSVPALRRLASRGASGLMNCRTAGNRLPFTSPIGAGVEPDRSAAYLTLGAGTRCAGGSLASEAYDRREPAAGGKPSDLYRRRNLAPAPPGDAIQVNVGAIRDANASLPYTVNPGALGSLAHRAGARVSVLGNADRPGALQRDGALVGMDAEGALDGSLEAGARPLKSAPFGLADDPNELARRAALEMDRSRLVVVDWGDSARLDDASPWMTAPATARARAQMLARLARLLVGLQRLAVRRRARLLVVAPYPSRAARAANDWLTPTVAITGLRTGLLTSQSTRRAGIVVNVDVAPTLAAWLGAGTDAGFVGRPLVSQPWRNAWQQLHALRARVVESERERRSVVSSLLSLWELLLAGLAGLAFVPLSARQRWLLAPVALIPVAIPVGAVAVAFVSWPGPGIFTAALAAGTAGVVLAAWAAAVHWGRGEAGLAAAAGLLVLVMAVDAARGFPSLPYCVLSYSFPEGARYYGVGNETMGAFLAAAILAGTAGWRRGASPGRWGVAGIGALLAGCGILLAGPAWGAKFGGAIAAAAAFTAVAIALSGRRLNLPALATCALAALVAVVVVVAVDLRRGANASHVGLAVRAVAAGGLPVVWDILSRKGSMDIHLLLYSPWSRVLEVAVLAGLAQAWSYAKVSGARAEGDAGRPAVAVEGGRLALPPAALGAGIRGVLTAAVVALLVDDAGALAAATAMVYVPVALYLGQCSPPQEP